MPEIIIETRGRTPLPDTVRKKMVSFRISPESIRKLDSYVERVNSTADESEKLTKGQAIENAIDLLYNEDTNQ